MLDRDSLLRRAELLRRQKRYKDAEREVGVVLQLNPEDVEALIILGHCKIDTKKLDEAITILKQCLQFDSSKDYVFYLLAFANYQKNDNIKALSFLREALSIFPFNAGYFALAAHIHIENKEFQLALDAANQGLSFDAENISCLNARSTALFRLNKKAEAHDTISEALSIDPENYITHTNYGWHYLEKGKHKEAANHFRESLRINPNYEYARHGYKSSLKAKLIFYRWLLQVNLWMSNKNKNVRISLILGLWLLFTIISSVSEHSRWHSVGEIAVLLYFVMVIFSWLGNSLANLYLLTTPHGKYILSHQEKWAARMVGICISLCLIGLSYCELFAVNYLFVPLVIGGMSFIFNELAYPLIPFKGNNRIVLGYTTLLLGIVCCIFSFFNISIAERVSIAYILLFGLFIWTGSMRGNNYI